MPTIHRRSTLTEKGIEIVKATVACADRHAFDYDAVLVNEEDLNSNADDEDGRPSP